MKRFVEGADRGQSTLFPECRDDWIDLVVVHEHMKTPTAQLADYILPGDSWLERPVLFDAFGWSAVIAASEKAVEPPGECRSVYDFWRGLAIRIGLTLELVTDERSLHVTALHYTPLRPRGEIMPNSPRCWNAIRPSC